MRLTFHQRSLGLAVNITFAIKDAYGDQSVHEWLVTMVTDWTTRAESVDYMQTSLILIPQYVALYDDYWLHTSRTVFSQFNIQFGRSLLSFFLNCYDWSVDYLQLSRQFTWVHQTHHHHHFRLLYNWQTAIIMTIYISTLSRLYKHIQIQFYGRKCFNRCQYKAFL